MLAYARPSKCLVCAAPLVPFLNRVRDVVYGVPGEWRLTRCTDNGCGTIHLDHDLSTDQIASFYAGYSTHSSPVLAARGVKRLYWDALAAIQNRELGYAFPVNLQARVIGRILSNISFFRQNALSRLFWLPAKPGGRAVEVGYGNAQRLAMLGAAGWEVTGCEFDEPCLELARQLDFTVHKGGLSDAKLESASVDAVVASHLIEHVPDPSAFIREAARVLRPGGHLVLITPNAAGRDAARYGRHWRGLETPRHLTVHTPASLRRMAASAGLTQIEISGTPLGGFIMQQTRESAAGRALSPRQTFRTFQYDFLAVLRDRINGLASEEIVLKCRKPG